MADLCVDFYFALSACSAIDRSPDWADVSDRLRESYRLAAPKRLLAALDDETPAR